MCRASSVVACCIGMHCLMSLAQVVVAKTGSTTIAVHAGHLFDSGSGTMTGQ